ncbi:general secretion pathway protein B [Duganella sacchari]|uniref:General secretion pathway protein B n=1 Tax=Duganella sacchari TaxID=551987 RepID=A0A1M7R2C7_9BURK|nr:general secretion pathway protein GspB [Duganella sacchari]SHN38696.1 general secretion pathway protein B [Duganella sacchari]
MSYILEALKKAQAERQLGSSPTIHAPTLQTAAASTAAGRFSKSMLLAVVGMAAVIGVLLVLVMRPASVPAVAPAPVAAVVPAPVSTPVTPTPLPAPVADLPPSVANLARASVPEAQLPAPVAATKPAAAPEEPVMNQRDLPEPIQRSIPQVAVGGYIYSKNPADRLLLVDKVLRHEGEEVAPGLVLEKLQPKEAVFSFKGYRYRVPY